MIRNIGSRLRGNDIFEMGSSVNRSIYSAALVALLSAASYVASTAHAQQNYPVRPVRLVVPSSPGGGTDITARIIAPKLGEYLGQQVVVENRPGAGTMIGGEFVARAAPDGYTLLMGISTLAINPAMYKKVPYDALKDFAPISQVVALPNILVTHPSLPVKSVKELIAFARKRPGEINYGSPGAGSQNRLEMEVARHGKDAVLRRSYWELQRSISREELARTWPHADVDAALLRGNEQLDRALIRNEIRIGDVDAAARGGDEAIEACQGPVRICGIGQRRQLIRPDTCPRMLDDDLDPDLTHCTSSLSRARGPITVHHEIRSPSSRRRSSSTRDRGECAAGRGTASISPP